MKRQRHRKQNPYRLNDLFYRFNFSSPDLKNVARTTINSPEASKRNYKRLYSHRSKQKSKQA